MLENKEVGPNQNWETYFKAAQELEKEYAQELERTRALRSEMDLLKNENQDLNERLKAQEIKIRIAEKKFLELKKEIAHLRDVYPIYDLLSAKEAEVERMKKALKTVPKDHPERATIESMVKAHIVERDELRWMAQEAEKKFANELAQVEEALVQLAGSEEQFPESSQRPWQVPEF